MPNRLLLRIWFGSVDGMSTYDYIGANVDLPALTITTERKDKKL
jgi:hypothetical protein